MDNKKLHPELAKIAAAYDEIYFSYANGNLDDATAQERLNELFARDDQGIMWHIAADGKWYCQNFQGEWVEATPPEYGIAVVSPRDVSNNTESFNPDSYIHKDPVHQTRVYEKLDSEGLVGSTWAPPIPPEAKSEGLFTLRNLLLAGFIALVVAILYTVLTNYLG